MIPRVLITPAGEFEGCRSGARVALSSAQRHYLTRVLRLEAGAPIEAFDGKGRRWHARLGETGERFWIELGEVQPVQTESPISIRLGQCLSSAERMDWTVEKAVELGVRVINPISSARSQIRLDAARANRKLEHWRAIAEAACMQSQRDVLPTIEPLLSIEQWVVRVNESLKVMLDPWANSTLSSVVADHAEAITSVCLLVGPESGLSDEETSIANRAGFLSARLGPRVLRTETAGLAAMAALQALAGDY